MISAIRVGLTFADGCQSCINSPSRGCLPVIEIPIDGMPTQLPPCQAGTGGDMHEADRMPHANRDVTLHDCLSCTEQADPAQMTESHRHVCCPVATTHERRAPAIHAGTQDEENARDWFHPVITAWFAAIQEQVLWWRQLWALRFIGGFYFEPIS